MMNDEIEVTNFDELWGVPAQETASNEKPALGPHRFTVKQK